MEFPVCPANIDFFKINNRNNRKRLEICSKLTIKTPKRCLRRLSVVYIVNFKHISYFFSIVSIVDFEQVNIRWVSFCVNL